MPTPPPAADSGAAAAGAANTPAGDTAKPAAPDAAADAKPAADAKEAAEKKETRDQAYWSKRMSGMRAQLERDQTYLAALESRISSLNMDFVNRDDPAQRDQIANDRIKAINELERLKKNIEQDKRDIDDLEEEARKAGVPPGWLR